MKDSDLSEEKSLDIFDPLIQRYGFKLSASLEEDKKIILANDELKIIFTEEYRPPRVFTVRLYDGKSLYLGLNILYQYKNLTYSLEEDSRMTLDKLETVTDFLMNNYSDLLSGDEEIKRDLLAFSKGKSKY